jgi:ferritin
VPSERFAAALTEQMDREFTASHQYLAFAAYYDSETFPRLAQHFYAQAEEERGHALKMLGYLVESSGQPRLGQIAPPAAGFEDHVAPIRLALEQERVVTVEIGRLVDIARETGDHASEVFLHWFVQEQVEEEASMEALLQVAERTRDVPMMLEDYVAREGARAPGAADADA